MGASIWNPGAGSIPVSTADLIRYKYPWSVDSVNRTVENRLADSVSVKDFGALGDGVTDDTAAIQAAIDAQATSGGTVFFPVGIYRVSQIWLKSYVGLTGPRRENGWARLLSFDKGAIIKALDGSGLSPVKLQSPAINWSIENLIIDANKANQTAPGVHCIEHRRSSATGSPGGLIKGVKCVNATGFGAYIIGAHPLEISECFFMSGIYLGRTFDTLVHGCSIDGTDSKHPAVWIAQSEHLRFVGNFIFRGESPSQTVSQTYTVDTVNDTITVTDGSAFYDGQPVVLSTSGTFPDLRTVDGGINRGSDTYLVKKLGGNVLELYWSNDQNIFVTTTKVFFGTAGTGTQTISSGVNDIIHITRGTHLSIADSRVAGSPGGALRAALCTYLQYDNIDHWALNWDDSATQPAVRLTGVQNCTLSNSQLGDSVPPVGKTSVREAVLIENDTSNPAGATSVSEANILIGNQYRLTQGLFVNDISTPGYETRNIIVGWDGAYGQTTNRIFSPLTRRQPNLYYYSATTSTATVANTANTTFAWAPVTKGDPAGVGVGSVLSFAGSANSMMSVKGKIGFSNRVAGAHYVLVLVAVGGVSHRFVWEQESNTNKTSYIVIPFEVNQVVTTDTTVSITVFHNAGATLNVATGSDYTQLSVTKIADYLA